MRRGKDGSQQGRVDPRCCCRNTSAQSSKLPRIAPRDRPVVQTRTDRSCWAQAAVAEAGGEAG
eukprot:1770748-Prymnesium_polylepis.1